MKLSKTARLGLITLISVAGTIVFLASLVSLVLHANPLCGEEVMGQKNSPDGKNVAVLMERNCGATTDYVYHVNLRKSSEKLSSGFFDGTIKEGEVFTVQRVVPRIEWAANNSLLITAPQGTLKPEWNNIRISYSNGLRH